MRSVIIAPDSFKGTLTATLAAEALGEGWRSARPDDAVRLIPMADGGEGTLELVVQAVPGARRMPVEVLGPDDVVREASWVLLPPDSVAGADAPHGVGVVELASTSGIELLDAPRPQDAHTVGFGQAIAAALDHGVSKLVLGIGSSASTDGGLGLLTALGARPLDAQGAPVPRGLRGLASLTGLDLGGVRALPPGGVVVITDVTNPLTGPAGAAAVFGPQKGLTAAEISAADARLTRLAECFPAVDPATPGAGAAGGVGFGLLAWGAQLVEGARALAVMVGLPELLSAADIVITGEGSYDGQSDGGKVPAFIADLARQQGCTALLAAGVIGGGVGIDRFGGTVSLIELAGSAEAAMADPQRWLREAGRRLATEVT